jgi:hypothetical protein
MENIHRINIYTAAGHPVLHASLSHSFSEVNVEQFDPGIYYVELITAQGKIRQRVVVN